MGKPKSEKLEKIREDVKKLEINQYVTYPLDFVPINTIRTIISFLRKETGRFYSVMKNNEGVTIFRDNRDMLLREIRALKVGEDMSISRTKRDVNMAVKLVEGEFEVKSNTIVRRVK